MDWSPIINTILGGFMGAVSAILVARLSKSRAQRDVEVAKEYLSLAGITADQLEARINLIGKLDTDVRKLENENSDLQRQLNDLKAQRVARDERMLELESQVTALQAQVDKDARDRDELRKKLGEYEFKNRVLWKYTIALLEHMKKHRIKPPLPPENLTDPDILKLVKENGDEENPTQDKDV
jgi:chromosome segregation ATPase